MYTFYRNYSNEKQLFAEDDDVGYFEDAEDIDGLSPEGAAQLQRLEGLMVSGADEDEGMDAGGDNRRPGHRANGHSGL